MPDTPTSDDRVGAFQIEGEPVRGRIARLGPAIDTILKAHDYPDPVANLLGEACALAALVGSNLKFEGRLIVEARGKGPVRYVIADYDTLGGLRGYCRFDAEQVVEASGGFIRPGARTLLGEGTFLMTVDQGPDMDRYQGVTAIEGETLALCAEQYFAQSEQTPTRVRLAVGHVQNVWRAGGMLIQNIAEDDARGSTEEPWRRTQAFFETLGFVPPVRGEGGMEANCALPSRGRQQFLNDGGTAFDHGQQHLRRAGRMAAAMLPIEQSPLGHADAAGERAL